MWGRIVSSVSSALDINIATLSGCIDIVAVPQADSTLRSSPFHVRFGKAKLLRSREKTVVIRVNGEEIKDVTMKLGAAGEAFFIEEMHDNESPFEDELTFACSSDETPTISVTPPAPPAQVPYDSLEPFTEAVDDPAADANDPDTSAAEPTTVSNVTNDNKPSLWLTGDSGEFSRESGTQLPQGQIVEELTSGREISHQVRPHDVFESRVQFSLCGHLLVGTSDDAEHDSEVFRTNLVSWETIDALPSLWYHSSLVARFDGEGPVYPGKVALPLICSWVAYNRPITFSAVQSLLSTTVRAEPLEDKSLFRWIFGSAGSSASRAVPEPATRLNSPNAALLDRNASVYQSTGRRQNRDSSNGHSGGASRYSVGGGGGDANPLALRASDVNWIGQQQLECCDKGGYTDETKDASTYDTGYYYYEDAPPYADADGNVDAMPAPYCCVVSGTLVKKYRKSFRPTAEQLAKLNLRPGANSIEFCVSSSLQGIKSIRGTIYLWPQNARIIVSDVDGTITRSDVWGQLMPIVGRDWSHDGVADLYSKIRENGYYILYLTARAIGQADSTREYLFGLTQNEREKLPDGPLILSPDRLFFSFKREVIDRKPYVFKIAALKDIRNLFPPTVNPYFAGFGNRDTDHRAYVHIGIPEGRVFIIDHYGMVHHINRTYAKTYESMSAISETMFPPLATLSSYGGGEASLASKSTAHTIDITEDAQVRQSKRIDPSRLYNRYTKMHLKSKQEKAAPSSTGSDDNDAALQNSSSHDLNLTASVLYSPTNSDSVLPGMSRGNREFEVGGAGMFSCCAGGSVHDEEIVV